MDASIGTISSWTNPTMLALYVTQISEAVCSPWLHGLDSTA